MPSILPDGAHVRPARPEDAEPVLQVLCAAFGLDTDAARPLFYRDPYYDLSLKYVLETAQGGIVACLTVIPSTLQIRGIPLEAAGIAGVAALPSQQHRGYGSALLTRTVQMLASEGQYAVSALFAYDAAFYRRLGWETATRARTWTGTLPPSSPAALPPEVRRASLQSPADRLLLKQMRAALPVAETGLCRRDTRRWQVLELTTQVWEWYLCELPDAPGGYAAIERPYTAGEPIVVQEMASGSAAARGALRTLLAQIADGQPLSWIAAPEQPAAYGLPPCPEASLKPGMMLRALDLPTVLRALAPTLAAPLARAGRGLTLHITDPLCPRNCISLPLAPPNMAENAQNTDWLRAPIGIMSPLLTGDLLPSELAAQGLLEASSPAGLALADALFPGAQPFIASADQF